MAIDTPAKIAVLGAGPIGLEAALYARYLGYDVEIYERFGVAASVLRYGHVRMFTPFSQNSSTLGMAALRAQNSAWQPPAGHELLTGSQWAERYLLPLAQSDLLAERIAEQTEVVAVGREGLLKHDLFGDETRGDGLFRILLRSTDPAHRVERVATADVVIDATGTLGNHNWLGDGGIPALGELAAEPHIHYALPDVLGNDRQHYAGRSVLVIGGGYSAASNVVALAELARQTPDTWVTWITRSEPQPGMAGPIRQLANDPLAERDRLARAANALTLDDSNHVNYWPATTVDSITWHADLSRFAVNMLGRHAGTIEVDAVIANVGFHGDNRLYRELHVAECYVTGGPRRVGLALTGNELNSLAGASQRSWKTLLINPEPHFYILGSKSFGRNSQFLFSTGLEQIRDLFAIIGDRPELDLYATLTSLAQG